jgi:hypothetical protein
VDLLDPRRGRRQAGVVGRHQASCTAAGMSDPRERAPAIHPTALVDPSARLSPGVSGGRLQHRRAACRGRCRHQHRPARRASTGQATVIGRDNRMLPSSARSASSRRTGARRPARQ